MKNVSTTVETYRKLVKNYIDLHSYEAALFWADKVVTLTSEPCDIYWLAQCMYQMKQYHRAAHLLQSRNLEKTYILCNCLTVQCFLEVSEWKEALEVTNLIDLEMTTSNVLDNMLFDDTPKNQAFATMLLLKGKALESMDNRGLASDCYKQALQYDVYCFEAFDLLIKYQMLSASEELDLLNSLPITQQCGSEEGATLYMLYESKLKKYHTLSSDIVVMSSTPNLMKANDKNLLRKSLDIQVAEAERLYYNCDYQKCSDLTEKILKVDPYHSGCLPVHISCQVELKQSNKLFFLAHNLVDLNPNLAISWFAVGCYYYVIDKNELARRFLSKATTLDRLFGPAWLAYGHSFAIENEHDQAMAAYFKASELMKGCHLPLLYIGLECGLTNNVRLAEKFFKQAQAIAPDDPFVMHEMGVIAFQNLNFKGAENHFKDALARVKTIRSELIPRRWESLLNNLGHTCRKLKKYEEALEFHHQALLISPQSASTYSAIALNHALMGHLREAVDWFHKALGLKNGDSFCTTMLNYVIEQLMEVEEPYPGAPECVPAFDIIVSSDEKQKSVLSDASFSTLEVEMSDASGIVKD